MTMPTRPPSTGCATHSKFVGNSVKRSTGNRYAPFSRYPAAKVRIPIFVKGEYCAARGSHSMPIKQNAGKKGTRCGASSASVLRKRAHHMRDI